MAYFVFSPYKRTALEKIAAVRGLNMINPALIVFFDHPAFVNFIKHIFKMKSRIQRTDGNFKISEIPDQFTF